MADVLKWVVCDNLTITRRFFFKRNKSKYTNEQIEAGILAIFGNKDILDYSVINDSMEEIKKSFKCTEKTKQRELVVLPENSEVELKVYTGDSEGFYEEDDYDGSPLKEMPVATSVKYEHTSFETSGLDIELQISYTKRLVYSEKVMPSIALYKDDEGYISADVWERNNSPVGFPNSTMDAEITSVKIIFK